MTFFQMLSGLGCCFRRMQLVASKFTVIKRVFPLVLATYLVATQLLSVFHQHQPLDTAQGEVCLKCLVLQQASSALPAPLLSLYQPVVWLILPLASISDQLVEMQLVAPVARGPPSEIV
ncbi:hypothetical protein [Thiolapillus sp.]